MHTTWKMRDAKRPRGDADAPQASLQDELEEARRTIADITLECLCGICMEVYNRPCACVRAH